MSVDVRDIRELDIARLEGIVREYPWFGYARQVLLSKLAQKGRELAEVEFRRSWTSVQSREAIYYSVQQNDIETEEIPVIDFEEMALFESEKNEKKAEETPKIVVIGGDYFTKDDFAQLDDGNSFKIGKLGGVEVDFEMEKPENEEVGLEFDDRDIDNFYTETLARIYAEQGYYEEAMRVYAKLILLYPEKSAYFATLVNEVKSKNN